MNQTIEDIILAVDPGSNVMGYALIKVQHKKPELISMGAIKLSQYDDIYLRLGKIYERLTEIITSYHPTTFAIEAPFYGKNVQSMLKLGRAQGVAIAAAMQGGLSVTEYAPRKIKQAITGNGNADKEQVWQMLKSTLKLSEKNPKYLDASDALGVAMCHFYEKNSPLAGLTGKNKGWADFIAQHPDKIKK